MRFIVTSDIHIHNWSHNATVLPTGINSRLKHTWDRIKDVIDVGKIEKVDAWLNAGDLLHTKKIDGEVLDVAARALDGCPFPIYSIYGNHDLVSSVAEIGSSRAFSGKIIYLDNYGGNVVKLPDGSNLYGISFHSSRKKLVEESFKLIPENTSILMLHQGIMGALMADNYIADQEDTLLPKDLIDKAGLVICGHFHTPQFVKLDSEEFYKISGPVELNIFPGKTALIPGALEQHNWGDTGQERGCWIVDTTVKSLKFIPLSSPKFIIADEKTDQKLLKGNYVKWISKENNPNLALAETVVHEVPVEPKKVESHTYHLDPKDDLKKIIEAYVANNALTTDLELGKIIAEGKRLLCN